MLHQYLPLRRWRLNFHREFRSLGELSKPALMPLAMTLLGTLRSWMPGLCRATIVMGLVWGITGAVAYAAGSGGGDTPMSFSNRLLLNRASVLGQARIEIMILTASGRTDQIKQSVSVVGGRVLHEIPALGYLRVDIPISNVRMLSSNADISSYQIASNANMMWNQEGRPKDIANMYRGYEVQPILGEPSSIKAIREFEQAHKDLPLLTPQQAIGAGFTAQDDTGVSQWSERHPRWDGRGVTVALLESALPQFDHPTLRTAATLDGGPIQKVAGFVNTMDLSAGDETRVSMNTLIQSGTAWYTVGHRTYILPRDGTFRFGILAVPVGGNLRQEFAVLWDTASGEIWVDSDGDADFRNEKAMRDVNERFDIGQLQFTQPSKYTVAFVVAKTSEPETLFIYLARGGHNAMTASVAVGSRTSDGLASGVAPNARVLFVRDQGASGRASDFLEGYAEIVSRPDVDVLSDSRAVIPMPDLADEFYSMFFDRLTARYHKPIFHSGGNNLPSIGSTSSLKGVFSVGGSISPATYAALYGGGELEKPLKHPLSGEGPGGDGGFKPDFLAPMSRISADKCAKAEHTFVPKNVPTARLPPCYQISCCTSASGPYAAGVAALLISAGRQQGDNFTLEDLGRALHASAQYLRDTPAYAQGAGILDINAAWKELHRKAVVPKIQVSSSVIQPMARYGAHPGIGAGLFEFSGWAPGQSGERSFNLRRESGDARPITYRISWTGNDGTFESADTVRLPLNQTAQFPVKIHVTSFGPHSAILNLLDSATGAILVRSLATIVAPQSIRRESGEALLQSGTVPLMQSRDHYISVPPGTAVLRVDLNVQRGALSSRMNSLDPTENVPNRPVSLWNTLTPGKYTWSVPTPSAGTWSLSLANDSGWREQDPTKVSTKEAAYSVSFSLPDGEIEAKKDGTRIVIQASAPAADIGAPAADVYPAMRTVHEAAFSHSGEPNIIPIEVPVNSGVLRFHATAAPGSSDLEMYLYDCTTGQCFYWDYAGTSSQDQTLTVHRPNAGKWLLAVNAAPAMVGKGGFRLEEIVGAALDRHPLTADVHWQAAIDIPTVTHSAGDQQSVLYVELVDSDLQDTESQRISALASDDTPPEKRGLANPVAIASTIYRLE
jgi:hypothetical protein